MRVESGPSEQLDVPVLMRLMLQQLQMVDSSTSCLPWLDVPASTPMIWALSDIPASANSKFWRSQCLVIDTVEDGCLECEFWMVSHSQFSVCEHHPGRLNWMNGAPTVFVDRCACHGAGESMLDCFANTAISRSHSFSPEGFVDTCAWSACSFFLAGGTNFARQGAFTHPCNCCHVECRLQLRSNHCFVETSPSVCMHQNVLHAKQCMELHVCFQQVRGFGLAQSILQHTQGATLQRRSRFINVVGRWSDGRTRMAAPCGKQCILWFIVSQCL